MKKTLITIALMLATTAVGAQDDMFAVGKKDNVQKTEKKDTTVLTITASGAYEKKTVVIYDGVNAQTLYVRALETLSDWAGSQDKSKLGIDVLDKDKGLVVYKGQLYLGYHKVNAFTGWNVLADFTVKIRCKDGRAQFTCTVPSMTFINNPNTSVSETAIMADLIPEYRHKQWLKVKRAAMEYAPTVPSTVDAIINGLSAMMQTDGDDF